MKGLIISELNQIYNPKGDVLHALKKSDPAFLEFGEAYFTSVDKDKIKGVFATCFCQVDLCLYWSP